MDRVCVDEKETLPLKMKRNTLKTVILREIRQYNVKFSVFNILLALLVSIMRVCVHMYQWQRCLWSSLSISRARHGFREGHCVNITHTQMFVFVMAEISMDFQCFYTQLMMYSIL